MNGVHTHMTTMTAYQTKYVEYEFWNQVVHLPPHKRPKCAMRHAMLYTREYSLRSVSYAIQACTTNVPNYKRTSRQWWRDRPLQLLRNTKPTNDNEWVSKTIMGQSRSLAFIFITFMVLVRRCT